MADIKYAPSDFSNMETLQTVAIEERTPQPNPNLRSWLAGVSDATRKIREAADAIIKGSDANRSRGYDSKVSATAVEILDTGDSFGFADTSTQQNMLVRLAHHEAMRQLSYRGLSDYSSEMYCTKCRTSKTTAEFTTSIFRCDKHF